jgi:selT/selW/selH-like putative selenoprotein
MKRNFVNVANFLEQTYPELRGRIEGENYPPPPAAELASNILSALQFMALLYMFFGGERVMRMLGYRVLPAWYETVRNSSVQIGIALFLILPQVLSKWLITGAFEIYLDGNKVWSKLETGEFPTMDAIIYALNSMGLVRN